MSQLPCQTECRPPRSGSVQGIHRISRRTKSHLAANARSVEVALVCRAGSSRETPSTESTEIRNSVSRQDAEPQRKSSCCLSLRLRGLARNIPVEDHGQRILENALRASGRKGFLAQYAVHGTGRAAKPHQIWLRTLSPGSPASREFE